MISRRFAARLALLFWFLYSPLSIMAWYEFSSGSLLEFALTYVLGFGVFVCLLLLGRPEKKEVKRRGRKPKGVEKNEKEKTEVEPHMRTDVDLDELDAPDDIFG